MCLHAGRGGSRGIPPQSIDVLTKVGEWMKKNGESIYGTTASPFPPQPWGRCTVKDDRLYLHVFYWPAEGELVLPGLKNNIKRACLLVDRGRCFTVSREGDVTRIDLPRSPVDLSDTVILLDIEGLPLVEPTIIRQQEDGTLSLGYVEAVTRGKTVKRFNRKGKFHISKWSAPSDVISWSIDVFRPGPFDVEITYAAQQQWTGREFIVDIGSHRLRAKVQGTGDWYEYKSSEIGAIELPEPGRYEVTIRPAAAAEEDLMYFKSMVLRPTYN